MRTQKAPGTTPFHERRLEELRRRIEDGSYEPDAEAIARELVRRGFDAD